MAMLGKIRATIIELGFVDALVYGAGLALGKCSRKAAIYRYALMAQPVPERPLLPGRRGSDIAVRLMREPGFSMTPLGLAPAVVHYRYGQGALCFAAFKKDALVGALWICPGSYEEDEVRCRFVPTPPGSSCWDLGIYVDPEHRGGIVLARLWDEANAYLRGRGIGWSLSRIGTVNRLSIASHERLGARRIGTATYLCYRRAQFMIATVAPYLHFSLASRSKPTLKLHSPS